MQLRGALILLFLTTSTVCGLRCYTCTAAKPRSCTDTKACSPGILDRCYSLEIKGVDMITKGCMSSVGCGSVISCCEGDLCNKAKHTGPSVLLLLLSWAMISCL